MLGVGLLLLSVGEAAGRIRPLRKGWNQSMSEILFAAGLAILASLTAGLSILLLPSESALARDLGLSECGPGTAHRR
jgi:hypothetical protein